MVKELLTPAEKRESAWESTKSAFNAISESRFGDAIRAITHVGTSIVTTTFNVVVRRVALIVGIDPVAISGIFKTLRNKELTLRQKILPVLGLVLAITTAIPIAIATLIGAAALIPPLTLVASIAGLIRDTTELIKANNERSNLRKKLVSREAIEKKIHKQSKLNNEQKAILKDSLSGEKAIFTTLYQIRQNIINHPNLSTDKKVKLVNQVNAVIEGFAQGKPIHLNSLKANLTAYQATALSGQVLGLEKMADHYADLRNKISHYPLSKSLQKDLSTYHARQNTIYCQSIPEVAKKNLEALLNAKKLDREELKLFYAKIGNYYLNSTVSQQLNAQDITFDKKVARRIDDESQRQLIRDYVSLHRAFYVELQKMHGDKLNPHLSNYIQHYIASPFGYNVHRSNIENPDFNLSEETKNQILAKIDELERYSTRVNALFPSAQPEPSNQSDPKQVKLEKLRTDIHQHLIQTLSQRAAFNDIEFRQPTFEVPKAVPQEPPTQSYSRSIKGRIIKRLFGEKSLERRARNHEISKQQAAQANELQSQFEQKHRSIFELVEQRERLHFLNKAVPRYGLNLGLHAITATVSAGASFALPAIFTPGAPFATTASVILGGLTTALATASAVNMVELNMKEKKSKMKVRKANETITSAISPDRQADEKIFRKIKRWHKEPKPTKEKNPSKSSNRKESVPHFYSTKDTPLASHDLPSNTSGSSKKKASPKNK